MAVYIDQSRNPYKNMVMCHMLADTPDELHEMALKIGMRLAWFQPHSTPHYDVCRMRRLRALTHGAIEINRRETVEIIRKIRANTGVDWRPQTYHEKESPNSPHIEGE